MVLDSTAYSFYLVIIITRKFNRNQDLYYDRVVGEYNIEVKISKSLFCQGNTYLPRCVEK